MLLFMQTNNAYSQDTLAGKHFISFQNESYEGPGINWLLQRADSCQFILFGEQHGVAGVAELVDYLYQELQGQDFHHLALETDGWTTARCAAMGVQKFARKNPHSIAFDSNGDLQLMQTAVDLKPDITHPLWGLDQMQTAIHPFQRLTELATSEKEQRIARGAFLKAVLKMGRYTRQDHLRDIEVIEKVFAENPSPEKEKIIKELRKTIDIFSKWMDPTTRQESVANREALMKQNFDNYWRESGYEKAIFKMGGAHTMYGIGPNGVETLGEHVRQVTENRNQVMLSISLRRYDPTTSLIEPKDFGTNSILLLDTQVARDLLSTDSIDEDLSRFDAIIFLQDSGYASSSINRAYENDFRKNLVGKLIPFIVSLFICLLTVMVSIILVFKNRNKKAFLPGIASLLLLLLVVLQILQIRSYPDYHATLSASFMPLMVQIIFGISALGFLFYTVRLFFKNELPITSKIFYSVFSIGYAIACFYLYYWNIGGMLF